MKSINLAILIYEKHKFSNSDFQPQAEEITAEEQAGFRAGRSTTEQIFNLRILCEKYLQHQHLSCLHRLQKGT